MINLTQKEIGQLNDLGNCLLYQQTWAFDKFIHCPEKIIGLFCGNQCLGGETEIYDPVLGRTRIVQEIESDFHVLAWNGSSLVCAEAQRPFTKEEDDLYTFTLSNGESFVASMGHRVLTPSGWRALSQVPVGSPVFLPQLALESCLSSRGANDPSSVCYEQPSLLVTHISFKRKDFKWDFTVPEYHNYWLAGAIHHNSFKTSATAFQYVLRILGVHPIPDKNVLYFECASRACNNGHRFKIPPADMFCPKCNEDISKFSGHKFTLQFKPKDDVCPYCKTAVSEHIRGSRIFRFASETLPSDKESVSLDGQSAEIKNSQYPEFKKWLPKFLIKRDITFRNPSMAVIDPHGRGDIIVELVSYSQTVQQGAGVQRLSCWEDEQSPQAFHNEQLPRLLAEDGDLIISLTPADKMTYLFDEVYEKAAIYYRTPIIADVCKRPQIERTQSPLSIAVIQAATDDNPTLDKRVIERMFENYDDPDVIAARRYGIFHQSTGRIHEFDYSVHFIDVAKYFPDPFGIPHGWLHARMEDYHESVNLAIVWIALSQDDEAFVYCEWNPSPEKFVTYEVARKISQFSRDYRYDLNLIDPLANKTQSNTGLTVIDDMNRFMKEFQKEGIGCGGYWDPWDTKSTRGRDEVRKRLKNAKQCGKPFNNLHQVDGLMKRLPTLWIANNCKLVARSISQWRKDDKGEPEQRYSHFNVCIEAIFKDSRFRARRGDFQEKKSPSLGLFQGRM